MVRNQYSYWLLAALIDKDRADAEQRVNLLMGELCQSPLSVENDGDFVFAANETEITGEVKNGSIEEDTSIADCVRGISAKFPDFKFTLDELDEDDRSNGTTTEYTAGAETFSCYRRTLEPKEFDSITANDLIAHLMDTGHTAAADEIRAYIKSKEGYYGTL